jgi:DNA-binding protein HU-beta
MNKTQLIEAISEHSGITKGEAKRGLEAFTEVVASTLKEGDKVSLMGFGTFCVEKKNARMGRDPRNGAPIKIAARNAVKFRPGQELCDYVK